MKVEIIIDLGISKEDLECLAKEEEIVGGWKAFIERELELGLDDLLFDYNIEFKIIKIEEVKENEN